MAADNAEEGPSERAACPERVALEHEIRRWEAESENAARISARANGLLTVLTGILGLGLFKLSDLDKLAGVGPVAVRALLTFALLPLLVAFYKIFIIPVSRGDDKSPKSGAPRRKTRFPFASSHLTWPATKPVQPHNLQTEEQAVRIAFSRTARAAESLARRNKIRKETVESGQDWVVASVIVAALVFVCALWVGYLHPEHEAAHRSGILDLPDTAPQKPNESR
jgi:hypothetical protein